MKRLIQSLSIICALTITAVSCKDEPKDATANVALNPSSTLEMRVPNNFNYQTDQTLSFNFAFEEAPMSGKYKVEVYSFIPTAVNGALAAGFVNNGSSFAGQVQMPSFAKQAYIKVSSPDGSSFLTILPINGPSLSHVFYRKKVTTKTAISSPDCTSGCDQTTTYLNNNFNSYNANQVYCVSGNYSNGSVQISNSATVRLCGSGNIQTLNVNSNGTLEIIAGANVSIQNLNLNMGSNKLIIHSGATLTLTNNFSPGSTIENYGVLSLAALNLNNSANLINYSDITITTNSGSTNLNGELNNYGSIIVDNDLQVNSGSKVTNACYFEAKRKMNIGSNFQNNAFVKVGGLTDVYSQGTVTLNNSAMWSTKDLNIGGTINGNGTTSLFKVSDNSTGNTQGKIQGNLSFCDVDGNNFPSWAPNIIKAGVSEDCDLFIPTSNCNTEGNGTPQIVDGDGDGVADDLDEYPADPLRAANRFYPSANGTATIAFEDLWPNYGDYDFNDMVVDYRYQFVLNANNNVVDLKGDFTTVALGGSFNNGFGVQLDVASSNVNSVSGTNITGSAVSVSANGTEAGQAKATIIVFDEAETFMPNTTGSSFVNTISSNPAVNPATANVVINFSSPVTEANLGDAPFNPFIFIDQDRGREVHLAGQQPTELANSSFFGTGKDNTQEGGGTSYKSIDNLPWAININGNFMHPEEKEDIVGVYNLFANWAQSGGTNNTDWYLDNSGYINTEKLYQQP